MEIIKTILVYFGFGVLIVYPLIWILGFILKSEKFEEIKDRLRIILAIFAGIWIYNFNFKPSKSSIVEMTKEWYPNAKNINIASITESKIETDTYKAYVNFNINNNSTCSTIITIRKAEKKRYYDYSNNGYQCN